MQSGEDYGCRAESGVAPAVRLMQQLNHFCFLAPMNVEISITATSSAKTMNGQNQTRDSHQHTAVVAGNFSYDNPLSNRTETPTPPFTFVSLFSCMVSSCLRKQPSPPVCLNLMLCGSKHKPDELFGRCPSSASCCLRVVYDWAWSSASSLPRQD